VSKLDREMKSVNPIVQDYSVVICSYNRLPYLQRTVQALKKTNHEFEVILSDDHSNDGTIEWAEKSNFFDNIYVKPNREEYCLCTIPKQGDTN